MSMSIPHAIEAFTKMPSATTQNQSEADQQLANQSLSKQATSQSTPLNENNRFVTLSEQGRHLSQHNHAEQDLANRASDTHQHHGSQLVYEKKPQIQPQSKFQIEQGLSDAEQKEVEQLRRRDQEVKNHERAHASVGGPHAGAPQYEYETGPNGSRYAINGQVSIDLSAIANNPQATIDKMKQVYRAALAPLEPSSQDRSIASEAQRSINTARTELAKEIAEESEQDSNQNKSNFNQTQQDKQIINPYKDAESDNTNKTHFYQLV